MGYSALASEPAASEPAASPKNKVGSFTSQVWAIYKKNSTMKFKSRRTVFGCTVGGVPGFLLEILLPSLLILLLSIPKIFLDDIHIPVLKTADKYPIESKDWITQDCPNCTFSLCFQPSWERYWTEGNVLYAPNSTYENHVMDLVAKDISCPKSLEGGAFALAFWKALLDEGTDRPTECLLSRDACMTNPACYEPVKSHYFRGFASGEEAVDAAMDSTGLTRAVVVLDNQQDAFQYELRMNHSSSPVTILRDAVFAFNPQMVAGYSRHYWFFANMQLAIDRALLAGNQSEPADVNVQVVSTRVEKVNVKAPLLPLVHASST